MRLARIRRLGWRWAWHVVLLAFLAVGVCLGAGEEVRVVGPVSCKAMVMELGGEYAREVGDGLPLLPLDYRRSASGASAAGSFVKDRDLMLSWGKVGDDLRGLTRHRWRRLSPEGHVLGARALAVVVHARNPLDSLTMKQLGAIFSGKASDWRIFGGREGSIRRYGPPSSRPVMGLFRDRLAPGRRGRMVRKEDSDKVLRALATDPDGIGVVDAAAATSVGDSAKKLAVGGAYPNAQTIKDGSYPLSATLVLYVSPEASETAKGFARFITSGRGNETLREHGLMPAVRAVRMSAAAGFEELYGPDIRGVRETPEAEDDLALAGQFIESARTMELGPQTVEAMCEAAYGLAFEAPGGETVAFRALQLLREKAEDEDAELECAMKRVALYGRAYEASGSRAEGEALVDALAAAANTATRLQRHGEAAELWERAVSVGRAEESRELETLRARLPAFTARAETQREIQTLGARLKKNPGADAALRRRLLGLRLLVLDDPAGASRLVAEADEEALKTNLPLAMEPADELSEESALRLAEWYVGLSGQAPAGGRELMIERAKRYYRRFFSLHEDRKDALGVRARLGLRKVGGKVPPPGKRRSPRGGLVADLDPGDLITDVKLAEFVARHPNLRRVGGRHIGNATHLTDLQPLTHLSRLKSVDLRGAQSLRELEPLAALPRLRSLRVRGLRTDDVSGLAGASGLWSLDLSGAGNLSDLGPLAGLSGLRTLKLAGCPEVTDLEPVGKLKNLVELDLRGCDGLRDLTPLEELSDSLVKLDLRGCDALEDVYSLWKLSELKRLDLRGCPKVPPDDVEWLRRQLEDCRVTADAS